ncbi:MAG: hypothetical protein LBT04_10245 [Prevotellaceae bacterium]|jgi:carbon monoxide dehydrogenase subunit G|nr:hypothetical protein [Prevotellaceae bacterium]
MKSYESKTTTINKPQTQLFAILSDMRNLGKYISEIQGRDVNIKEFTCGQDFAEANIPNLGSVRLKIVEKEPDNTIKFAVENLPIRANLWVQLKEVAENDTKMKLVIKADIPIFLVPVLGSKLQEGLDKITDTLTFAINRQNF